MDASEDVQKSWFWRFSEYFMLRTLNFDDLVWLFFVSMAFMHFDIEILASLGTSELHHVPSPLSPFLWVCGCVWIDVLKCYLFLSPLYLVITVILLKVSINDFSFLVLKLTIETILTAISCRCISNLVSSWSYQVVLDISVSVSGNFFKPCL